MFRRCCQIEGGAPAFSAVTIQGEVRHNHQFSTRIHQALIHLALLIGKNPKCNELSYQKVGVFLRIMAAYGDKDKQTRPDSLCRESFYVHTGTAYALYDYSHQNI